MLASRSQADWERLPGTYEEAEGGRAGREGHEELQDAEAGVPQVGVVVGGALLAAQLLESPPLPAVGRVLHQRPQKRLTGGTGKGGGR